jgi:hypothetical protein
MFDIFMENSDGNCRFTLGLSGGNKLFVIGLNPSTATQNKSDPTVSRVRKIALSNGYDGFVMLNLYPERSTHYNNLPFISDNTIYLKNIDEIIKLLSKVVSPKIWVAWGEPITSRNYFGQALFDIYERSKSLNVHWLNYGNLTKSGHPRHPSRASYDWTMSEFNIKDYIEKFTKISYGK